MVAEELAFGLWCFDSQGCVAEVTSWPRFGPVAGIQTDAMRQALGWMKTIKKNVPVVQEQFNRKMLEEFPPFRAGETVMLQQGNTTVDR